MELSVVVPVFNEEDNIAPLVEEIVAALKDVDYEIIYVNDGSTDGSLARLQELQQKYPQLRVLQHAKSCGQSTAIHTGVQAARGEWIATLDGDGQNDPADIPDLFKARETFGDKIGIVCGWRAKRQDTWVRRMSSRIANGVRSSLLKDETPDTGCGLKLFRRKDFLALPYFNHMHRFLPALMQRSGGKVQMVRVNHRHRTRGTSKYGIHNRLWVGIVDLFGVMWLQRRAKLPEISEVRAPADTSNHT